MYALGDKGSPEHYAAVLCIGIFLWEHSNIEIHGFAIGNSIA